jgi:N-methylhydantoinase A
MGKTDIVAVGIDVGGTFTDFVLHERATGAIHVHKILSNPSKPDESVIRGLNELLGILGRSPDQLELVIHGTTLVSNALLERKGAPTALLATNGFCDVLEIGTELRYEPYGLFFEMPAPLVPRHHRYGVPERINSDGQCILPLDHNALNQIATRLDDDGISSVAICFLHSFCNPEHEQTAASFLAKTNPQLNISLSSQVSPEIREYARMSTTVADAYVKPIVKQYLIRMIFELKQLGYLHPLYLMLSNGGVTTAEIAAEHPIRLVESGPAGGVSFATYISALLRRPQLVAFDMGGTTAKIACISKGQPSQARYHEVARVARFKPGSGLPLQVPVVELLEVGAGGGSLACVNELGLLKVGPNSAGADPGPACYGRGGTRPTVTDANLVLGYLSTTNFLGGEMPLYYDQAIAAIQHHVCQPLGLSTLQAAWGIFEVVNQNMIAATRVHLAEKGQDPRHTSLFATGGAGPIHAHALLCALDFKEVICPLRAGAGSALGFLTAPIAFELAQSISARLDDLRAALLAEVFTEMETEGYAVLARAGINSKQVRFRRTADMRYVGQGHEIEVPFPSGNIDIDYVLRLSQVFSDTYQLKYGHSLTNVPIEIITCRLICSGPEPRLILPVVNSISSGDARRGSRIAYFGEEAGNMDTEVYDRYMLTAGTVITGPAVIEERESTVVVPPNLIGVVDQYANVILQLS